METSKDSLISSLATASRKTLSIVIAFLSLAAMGCAKDGETASTTTTAAAASYYYLSNGICYSSSTGQAVATTNCSTTSTTGYYTANGACYATATGQVVSTTYCTTTSTTAAVSQVCVGYYYYYGTSGYQQGYCNGSNCRGYTLYQYGTNQQVTCQ